MISSRRLLALTVASYSSGGETLDSFLDSLGLRTDISDDEARETRTRHPPTTLVTQGRGLSRGTRALEPDCTMTQTVTRRLDTVTWCITAQSARTQ